MHWLICYYTDPERHSPWAIYQYNPVPKSELNKVFESYIDGNLVYLIIIAKSSQTDAFEEGKALITATFC